MSADMILSFIADIVKPTTATKRINEPPSEVPNVVQSR
jgi:hypothetical protein